jgi:multicomponent Na+:H+ antiporter subunit G
MSMDTVGIILMIAGAFFLLVGSIGVIRFPDFYCRAHAMGKPDTLGIFLCLLGLAFLNGWDLHSYKLLAVILFVAIANPTATHALTEAAMKTKLKAWRKK